MYNLISIFIGGLISMMILLNGVLSNATGNYTSSVIIHMVGLFSIIMVLLLTKSKFKLQRGIPLYLYSAGAIGVFTVLFNNLSFAKLGVSIPLALGLLGQSLASIIIDHFGLLEMKVIRFEKKKIVGLLIISLGIVVMAVF